MGDTEATPIAGDDVSDARWWAAVGLPEPLAFESSRRLLDQWINQQEGSSADDRDRPG